MNKSLIALAVAGMSVATAYAGPQSNSFYVGAKAGWASFHGDINQLDAKKVGHGMGYGINRNSASYGAFVGYQIVNNLAVEAGYDYFGRVRGTVKQNDNDAQAFKHTTHGATLALKTNFEVVKGLDTYAKAGIAFVNNRYNLLDTGTNQMQKIAESKNALLLAAGVEYAFSPSVAGHLEYQWLQNAAKGKDKILNGLNKKSYSPSIGNLSAGLTYRFGQGSVAEAGSDLVSKRFAFGADVLFDFGKSNLKPAAIVALEDAHEEIVNLGLVSPSIQVNGYTDRIGKDAPNLALSQRRAESVANYIASKGISPENITAVGYGKANPITGRSCDSVKGRNALIACLAPDRRVEVQIQGSKEVVM